MKRIAITQRVEIIESINERRDALSQEWCELADACRFIPVLIPNNPDIAVKILEELGIDGIILSGGNDLAAYGGNAPERDNTEAALIRYSVGKNIPLLGVCRGAQMLLHYFGARLEKIEGHVRTNHILTTGKSVNSFHGFGAKTAPACIEVIEKSEDYVIEEFTHNEYKNIYGIMWHPERYHPFRDEDLKFIGRSLKL